MVYKAYLKDQEFDMADCWMTECNAKLSQIKSDLAEDKLDRPVMFYS